MTLRTFAFIVMITIALVPAAYAAPMLSLSSTLINATAGSSVEFSGTLTNTGNADLYLNGDVSSLPFSFLSVDDSPFFSNAPLFLAAGTAYSGPLFDVVVDPAAAGGTYGGSYTIQGGSDSNAFENLGTADFSVVVEASSVPEPSSLVLCVSPLIAGFLWSKGRTTARSN